MSIYTEKLNRIRSGFPIRYLDLFSGCGGLSLGFLTSGYSPIASVEIDSCASESYYKNISPNSKRHSPQDITILDPKRLFESIGLIGSIEDQIDILIGGPPCQAFSRVGRAKLREQAHKREEITADYAFLVDSRVNLWERYIAYVHATKPIAVLMENVPDILKHGKANVADLISTELSNFGYEVRYTLLNSAWYGVPQIRERMILIGYHRDTNLLPNFPTPTHRADLPKGSICIKNTARKIFNNTKSPYHRFTPTPSFDLPPTTTVKEALTDLPPIYALDLLKKGELKGGAKNPLENCSYINSSPSTSWSRLMREWDYFNTSNHTTGHVIRFLPRDHKIFSELENGWEYPEIWQHMENKIKNWLNERIKQGLSIDSENEEVREYIHSWRIPYDPSKFPNKWRVLEADKPSRILLAHLGKDSYSHIHFDAAQARTISVREAARLQSFPDGFLFSGAMSSAFKQIGNAVPPLFAYALAVSMRSTLRVPIENDMRCRLLGIDPESIQMTEGHC